LFPQKKFFSVQFHLLLEFAAYKIFLFPSVIVQNISVELKKQEKEKKEK